MWIRLSEILVHNFGAYHKFVQSGSVTDITPWSLSFGYSNIVNKKNSKQNRSNANGHLIKNEIGPSVFCNIKCLIIF